MAIVLFFVDLIRALYPGGPDAPDPATAENTDIISYRDDVPAALYLAGGLAISIFVFLVWVIVGFAQHHAARADMFILVGVMGWPVGFTLMHLCLTGRYPEVATIWW